MAQTANTQEPTMEEILASIRRIISEDGDEQKAPATAAPAVPAAPAAPAAAAAKPAAKPVAKPAPEPEIDDEEDILELTDIVPEEEPAPPPRARPPASAADADDVVMVDRPAERAPSRAARSAVAEEEDQLISDRVRDQASSSFMQLARNVLVQEAADPRTLEHLVQEMLRPMLQQWLNENLPSMVEGLVQQEIERVTRRERR